jgi:hypothetical protein
VEETMPKTDIRKEIEKRSLGLKDFFQDMRAVVEQWKFAIEDTKDGTRIEIHAVALVKRSRH